MELNTFGAILGFAIEWEKRAAAFYEAGAQNRLLSLFLELAQGARRRLRRLEQARQEGVAEMILEPIHGLDGEAYRLDFSPETEEAALLQQARRLEETAARFYQDAASRMPIREVARLLQGLAQENVKRRERLDIGALTR
jgi:rubrerythrin